MTLEDKVALCSGADAGTQKGFRHMGFQVFFCATGRMASENNGSKRGVQM